MTKQEIFDQVVTIMGRDSSTKKDKQGADPVIYREQIDETMTEKEFARLVNRYLNTFGVLGHVAFFDTSLDKFYGFSVRPYQESLFVTVTAEGTGFEVGDEIKALDGQTIAAYYESHQDEFASPTPERQTMSWRSLVGEAKKVTVLRNGQEVTVQPSPQRMPQSTPFEWMWLNEETVYLKLENFSDEVAINQLYQEAFPAIEKSKYLIIDVRVNNGGSDGLFLPLLKYTLPRGENVRSVDTDEDGMEILYTDFNVDVRLKQFDEDLASPDLSPEHRTLIEEMKAQLLAHRGKGYVTYDLGDDSDWLYGIIGQAKSPERIIVLSDVLCGSSGDSFVHAMKLMPKVTVLGRPTMGIMDYSNVCRAQLDQYCLIFPTSRMLSIDEGRGTTDKGIEPDIYIEWTPEHLVRDVDLEQALALLGAE